MAKGKVIPINKDVAKEKASSGYKKGSAALVDAYTQSGYEFKAGNYFGIEGDLLYRFYYIDKVRADGSLVLDVYRVKDGEAYCTNKSNHYMAFTFNYRIGRGDMWQDDKPRYPIKEDVPPKPVKKTPVQVTKVKKDEKTFKPVKPINTAPPSQQGSLF